jgi:putative spermidine/putrescine transport system ATP-binding protein
VDLGKVNLGQISLGQISLGQISLGQIGLGQIDLGQIDLGQIDLGPTAHGPIGQVNAATVGDGAGASAAALQERIDKPTPAAPILLSLKAIVKAYGAVSALGGIDLEVPDGQIVTILGPSGSGKTTLLKVVAGFEMPDSGEVELAGRVITHATPASRGIGMVFQNYALFPHMRVAENIAFPLQMRRLPRSEIRDRVGRALALVGLTGYEGRYPRELSGGQQQRVALARAIVFEPRLLLLDEPFGALDRKLREQMQLEVKHLQRRLGITALFVTHDQEEALVLSDRIAVMNGGSIEQIGSPADVYARPANRFVADFIGESNIYRGKVTASSAGTLTARLASGQAFVARGTSPRPIGADVGLVLRPEAPRRLPDQDNADNVASGCIQDVVYVGDAVKYAIRLDGGGEMVVRWPFYRNEAALRVGQTLRIGWSGDLLHVVDWT